MSWARGGLGCAVGCALLLSACSDDDAPARDARVVDARARDASRRDAAVRDAVAANPFNTVAAVKAFFDGKTVVMEGSNIPSHPQGADENMNLGPTATQCLHKVTIKLNEAPQMVVTTELGTLNGASTVGSVGTCDRTTKLGEPFVFTTTSVVIENVAANGSCFDITANYTGFSQQGRGTISADGRTIRLELYIAGVATGQRCADGPPGSATVKISGQAFTGNAVGVFAVAAAQ